MYIDAVAGIISPKLLVGIGTAAPGVHIAALERLNSSVVEHYHKSMSIVARPASTSVRDIRHRSRELLSKLIAYVNLLPCNDSEISQLFKDEHLYL